MTKNIIKILDFKVKIYYNSSMGYFVPIYIKIKEGNIMIKNKICKILVSIIITTMIIATVGQTAVFASKKTENKTLTLSNTRWVKNGSGTYIEKGAYSLNTGSNYPIFQIVSKSGNDVNGTNFYCIKGKLGDTWGNPNNSIGEEVVYNTSYDFATDKTEIGNLSKAGYANTVSNNYGPIMWIFDNMYTEGGITTTQLLNNAGIVYGPNPQYPTKTDWHYDSEELVWEYGYEGYKVGEEDVILQTEEIEAIQQAAIWHFTNSGDSEFDFNIQEVK